MCLRSPFQIRIVCSALAAVLFSCRSVPASHVAVTETTQRPEKGGIILMTFHMRTDGTGKNIIELISTSYASGTLKQLPAFAPPSNSILVREVSNSETVLQMVPLEHPLYKSVESTDENHRFVRKDVVLKDAEFFVRLPLVPSAVAVELEEIQDSTPVNTTRFPLK